MSKQIPEKIDLNDMFCSDENDRMLARKFNELYDYLSEQGEERKEDDRDTRMEKQWGNSCHTPVEKKGKCNGAHCKCMNLDKQCPNFHYGDHDCPLGKPVETEWEKNFDIWWRGHCTYQGGLSSNLVPDLKSFIRSLLTTTIQEERARVKGIIEKKIIVMQFDNPKLEELCTVYNKALSDLLSALDEKN